MAHKVADPCRNCGADLAPGTSFCTLCGTAVPNRAAAPAPTSVPLVGQPFQGQVRENQVPGGTMPRHLPAGTVPGQAHGGAVPGIIPVGLSTPGPLVAPQQVGGDARLAAAAALVPGGAGRRLAAKVIDGVVPGILLAVAVLVGAVLLKVTPAGEIVQDDLGKVLLALTAASLLSMAYGVWVWIWEARAGKTPGNVMLGLRTTSIDGSRPGLLAIFLRYLIIGVASIVPVVGPVLVIVSNTWDSNGKWQGWHDKVAKTLVFNVKAGRNPLETGGVAGRTAYTPAPVATLSPVQSPLPAQPAHGPGPGFAPGQGAPGHVAPGHAAQGQVPAQAQDDGPITSVPSFARATVGPVAPGIQAPAVPSPAVQDPALNRPAAQPPVQPHGAQPPVQPRGAQPPTAQGMQYSEPVSFAPPPPAPSDSQVTDPLPGMRVTAPLPPEQGSPQDSRQAGSQADTRAYGDADAEAGETRIRPAANKDRLRLTFDDGRQQDIDSVALIGRNPAGYDGEMISRLITVRDTSMSVSKTHLHVRASTEGLWVTDRNSTNGSAISDSNGAKVKLSGSTPALASMGARVHFGERSFVVGRA
ncbi:RDD family protein [Arthrobacter sp. PAMC 25486]|uniref:RDD family protein n=1 Tax=Arthrobacter sp. PAMC 25486 TaxID=1494608 RepID=UPI000570D68E|nr:RDD family protein [Arthrobacter sp. PAMC 25486]